MFDSLRAIEFSFIFRCAMLIHIEETNYEIHKNE